MPHEDIFTPQFARRAMRFICGRKGLPAYDEDLIQEALLRALSASRRVGYIQYPSAFFGKIMRDVLADFWRKKRPLEVELRPEWIATPEITIEENLDRKKTLDQIHRAIQCLDERDRTVLELFYFEDCSIRDIAHSLGMSESATKMVLMRNRRRLASILQAVPLQRS